MVTSTTFDIATLSNDHLCIASFDASFLAFATLVDSFLKLFSDGYQPAILIIFELRPMIVFFCELTWSLGKLDKRPIVFPSPAPEPSLMFALSEACLI
ncbi:hypothetical protein Tco_0728973 [Tanacetum coccineum]|uniref:Uncharacterized protein n=1 Tax=Tanacetum coccineum TaxID=301880 RepID=A0ABQ4YQB4_9ASTR